jgi:hypothetical protein
MAEGDLFDPTWAQDSDLIDVPTDAEIRRGFTCGPVTPGRFNWLFQQIHATINALGLGDFVNSLRKIQTTEGISGGGDLSLDRTLQLDLPGLEEKTDTSNDDVMVIYDPATSKHRRQTRANFLSGVGGEGGAISGGENVGTGGGSVFKSVASGLLQFRKLLGQGGITVATDGDDVTFALADLGSELTVE